MLINMRLGAVLYVYKGEWGLPSIDFECLRALCLVKFTRCPVKVENNRNPMRSSEGKLPYLQIGNEKFVGYRRIKDLLDKEGYPIDANLDDEGKFLSMAYTNLVFTNLHAYYNYIMFGDQVNFDQTRALYAKRTPFPFNFYYPGTYFDEANKVVNVLAGFDLHDKIQDHETETIIERAKGCVNLLSKKLGKKIWFAGDSYSEFDAIVYSYLSILCNVSLPNNPLKAHIKACPNLERFILRITKDIFQREGFSSQLKSEKIDPMQTPSEQRFQATKRQTQILAGLTAILVMGAYAALSGILRFSFDSEYDEMYDYEDEHDESDHEQ